MNHKPLKPFFLLFFACSGSFNGGSELSHLLFSRACSIILTSAKPAGKPEPCFNAARVKISGDSPFFEWFLKLMLNFIFLFFVSNSSILKALEPLCLVWLEKRVSKVRFVILDLDSQFVFRLFYVFQHLSPLEFVASQAQEWHRLGLGNKERLDDESNDNDLFRLRFRVPWNKIEKTNNFWVWTNKKIDFRRYFWKKLVRLKLSKHLRFPKEF